MGWLFCFVPIFGVFGKYQVANLYLIGINFVVLATLLA
ncbi:Uncharacterized protein ChrSV_5099 [Chromobacterium vaccinii]|nr:Uncharacterized protein ChrSW_5093 [Chromobacterium vaccinii]QND92554.1 Uncharacterized protein ChrSV_5099 [Chromobacterium vaccinii]